MTSTMTDKEEAALVFDLFIQAVTKYEEENPEVHIKDQAVLNASVTMLYHILAHNYNDDPIKIRKALDGMVENILSHARKATIASVKQPKIIL